jgi:hypothetical protein
MVQIVQKDRSSATCDTGSEASKIVVRQAVQWNMDAQATSVIRKHCGTMRTVLEAVWLTQLASNPSCRTVT